MNKREAPDVWMPLYIGAYLRKTARLTTEQHGAYLLLIMDYWVAGPPPDDDEQLASVTRLPLEVWKNMRGKMVGFFEITDGVWRHGRVEKELRRAKKISKERSKAGADGAAKRWQTASQTDGKPMANAMANASQRPSQNDTPSPSQDTSLRSVSSPRSPRGKPKTAISPNWVLSDVGRAYAEAKGYDAAWIDREAEAFHDHAVTHDCRYADWEAAWRTWVQNAPKFAGKPSLGGSNGRPGPVTKLFEGTARALDRLDQQEADSGTGDGPSVPLLDSRRGREVA